MAYALLSTSVPSAVRPAAPVSPAAIDPHVVLGVYRFGARDRTTRLAGDSRRGSFARATLTPEGPATVLITWGSPPEDGLHDPPLRPAGPAAANSTTTPSARRRLMVGAQRFDVIAWGSGADWLARRARAMLGADDAGAEWLHRADHPFVAAAARDRPGLRIGASGTLYHELLPVILGQRITAGEAVRQWQRLCDRLGTPAPGPLPGLRLPPSPTVLASQPRWWFHPLGIEQQRARPLIAVARHADRLWEWAAVGPAEVWDKASLFPGIGPWTIGSVLGPALGDPDAFAVGDYHLKHIVAYNLAGEARATDARMVELLAPFRGQRGRVTRLITLCGRGAPKYGARQRVLPMHRW